MENIIFNIVLLFVKEEEEEEEEEELTEGKKTKRSLKCALVKSNPNLSSESSAE